MSQEQAGVNGLSRHKRQCAHWHLFHGSIDTGFPCERDNQRKQQRSSCLRRPQSMGREGKAKLTASEDEANTGELFPRYYLLQKRRKRTKQNSKRKEENTPRERNRQRKAGKESGKMRKEAGISPNGKKQKLNHFFSDLQEMILRAFRGLFVARVAKSPGTCLKSTAGRKGAAYESKYLK